MKQFIAHGFLRDKSSQNPIPGLRVEAWDKDLIFNDLVGSTHSDARGYFKMVFDRSYFRELFLDRFPDIYFRIFQGNRLIKDTKDSILWNTGKSEGGAFLEIEIDASRLDPFDSDTRFGETPSTRAIYQATYTPRKATKREQEQAANNARGVEKGAFIASLNVRENELEALKDRLAAPSGKGRNKPPEDAKLARAIQIISGAINQGTKDRFLWQAGPISTIGVQTLQKFAGLLLDYREELLNEVAGAQEKILKKQNRAVLRTAGKRKEAPVTERNALAIWSKGGKNTVADKGRQLAGILKLDPRRISPAQFVATARAKLQQQREYTGGLRGILEKEPVGYLHLEKMSFTPAGIERGELVYSLPMAPTEEVNITHKEWSHTEEEFERIVTDYMEAYSEEGVAEKSEFAQAVNSQSQHTSAFNVGVTASGSYAGFKISTSSGYNASSRRVSRSNLRETRPMKLRKKPPRGPRRSTRSASGWLPPARSKTKRCEGSRIPSRTNPCASTTTNSSGNGRSTCSGKGYA